LKENISQDEFDTDTEVEEEEEKVEDDLQSDISLDEISENDREDRSRRSRAIAGLDKFLRELDQGAAFDKRSFGRVLAKLDWTCTTADFSSEWWRFAYVYTPPWSDLGNAIVV
jgi:hypothetical protein